MKYSECKEEEERERENDEAALGLGTHGEPSEIVIYTCECVMS